MKALLLAGGRGTRMRPLTHTSNKHAIPIANKAMILYPFEMIIESGIKDIAVIVNETKEEIESILGDGSKWKVHVTYIFQKQPKGLAHALSLSEKFMGKSKFVLVLGDNILQNGIKKYVKAFAKSSKNGHILGVKVPISEHKRFGMATIDERSLVLRYIEKPGVVEHSAVYNPRRSYAVPGFYFFDHHVFNCFKGKGRIKPSSRGELEISSPYNWLIEHNYKVSLDVVKGWYKDPGNPDDTLITNQVILNTLLVEGVFGKVDKYTKMSGKIRIEKGAIIENSILRGPLVVGKNCTIKNCYVGPYTSIYDESVITKCEIENSIVLGNVHIANVEKRIDSSIIGWNVEVGKIVDHTHCVNLIIGDDSIIRL